MDGCKIEFYDTYKKKVSIFELFWSYLVYKFAKSANMTPKIFFPNIFDMGIKKRTIWCQLKKYQESLHKES
jgi:hypothetical protein